MQSMIARLTESLAHTSLTAPRPFTNLGIPGPARQALIEEFSQIQLKPAAVLIGLLPDPEHRASIILTRRSEALKNHPGQISFPGGRMDANDESLRHTALRESREEINLPSEMVSVLGYMPDYPTITGYRVTPVVGVLDAAAHEVMAVDGQEATELIHIPAAHALNKDAYERKMMERNGLQLPVYHLQYQNFDVWGATAGMLYQLCLHFNEH